MRLIEQIEASEKSRLKEFILSLPESDNDNPIPNVGSISSSLSGYQTFGVREVPTSIFSGHGKNAFATKHDRDRVDRLIGQIHDEGLQSPLIVVFDGSPHGMAYVLEGGHRLAAIEELGLPSFPALTVLDLE